MAYNPQNPNGQATSANSAPVVIASDQSTVNVTDNLTEVGGVAVAATAKGTQGSNFVPVQEAKDSGRTFMAIVVDGATGTTAKTLATLTINKGGTTSSATNYTVTSGKTLRIQSFELSNKLSGATLVNSEAYLVGTSSGTVATTSNVIDLLISSPPVATTNAVGFTHTDNPDGIEIPSGWNIGIPHIESATTTSVYISINGYEY